MADISNFISRVGFPVFVAVFYMLIHYQAIKKNTRAIDKLEKTQTEFLTFLKNKNGSFKS